MRVVIEKKDIDETKVVIECKDMTESIHALQRHIERFDERIRGKSRNELCYVTSADILYIESVDNRVFLYTLDAVVEVEEKLYELESILNPKDFCRNSKSQIVNINKIERLRPELNRTILVTLCNEELLYVSRSYVKKFKATIGL